MSGDDERQRELRMLTSKFKYVFNLDRILQISKWHHATHIDVFCSHFVKMRELSQAHPETTRISYKHGLSKKEDSCTTATYQCRRLETTKA